MDDLQANTEYTGYSAASSVVQWFWEVVKSFNKEDMARLLQFVTGTSKVFIFIGRDLANAEVKSEVLRTFYQFIGKTYV